MKNGNIVESNIIVSILRVVSPAIATVHSHRVGWVLRCVGADGVCQLGIAKLISRGD